jgi:hypothetical protein
MAVLKIIGIVFVGILVAVGILIGLFLRQIEKKGWNQ